MSMFLTAEEAAKECHCTPDTMRRGAAAGTIPARKIGRRWLFEPEQLRAYVRGEWHSANERPAVPGGLDSQFAVGAFGRAAAQLTGKLPKNSRPRLELVTGDKPS
jgi:excisionase family DNA binding protein